MSCIICIALRKKYGKYDLAISKDNPLTEHHVAPKTGIPLCRTCHDIVEGKKRRKKHIRDKIMEIINELGITKFHVDSELRRLRV